MRTSVIVPVLDEAVHIGPALDALAGAGFAEVWVVDGGSADGTPDLARARGAAVLHAPRGRAAQMNAGAARATGDVLLFLHADARLPPGAAGLITQALQPPEVVGGAFTLRTVPERRRHAPWLRLADLRSRYTRAPYGDQALFVRAEVFRRVGGFAELPLMEDLDLSLRLRREGPLARIRRDVRVSGRRFEARPVFYGVFMNVAPLLFRAGVPADRLARWYGRVR
ncbi:MAG: TIGR04283 family arsenosugar biosynthesis glycosyltransferase [Alphaproteobacteria bacterium]|nr:TIGR04283 family arsenosugar biosynthesis glycosyltransferase [Alphaproteobacteria bacterium]